MTSGDQPFDDFVEHLRTAFFALRAVSEKLLEGLDCTVVERGVLQELGTSGAQTVPAMAQARAVSRQAMQKTIDRMLDREWLAYAVNPRHRRSSLVTVTPSGRRLFATIRAREQRLLSTASLPVTEAELRRASRVLQEMGAFLPTLDPSKSRIGAGRRARGEEA